LERHSGEHNGHQYQCATLHRGLPDSAATHMDVVLIPAVSRPPYPKCPRICFSMVGTRW
jgi:hypothetical protein